MKHALRHTSMIVLTLLVTACGVLTNVAPAAKPFWPTSTKSPAPVWNDPVYLEKMQALISALALRYDGNPDIAFIDARNCGNWGEWHSLGCDELSDADKAALIDQWKSFKKTTIIVPTNGDTEPSFQAQYGTDSYGFGIRRDSSELDLNAASYAFDKAPAVSEWGGWV